jgi:hypothetical protein
MLDLEMGGHCAIGILVIMDIHCPYIFYWCLVSYYDYFFIFTNIWDLLCPIIMLYSLYCSFLNQIIRTCFEFYKILGTLSFTL